MGAPRPNVYGGNFRPTAQKTPAKKNAGIVVPSDQGFDLGGYNSPSLLVGKMPPMVGIAGCEFPSISPLTRAETQYVQIAAENPPKIGY